MVQALRSRNEFDRSNFNKTFYFSRLTQLCDARVVVPAVIVVVVFYVQKNQLDIQRMSATRHGENKIVEKRYTLHDSEELRGRGVCRLS